MCTEQIERHNLLLITQVYSAFPPSTAEFQGAFSPLTRQTWKWASNATSSRVPFQSPFVPSHFMHPPHQPRYTIKPLLSRYCPSFHCKYWTSVTLNDPFYMNYKISKCNSTSQQQPCTRLCVLLPKFSSCFLNHKCLNKDYCQDGKSGTREDDLMLHVHTQENCISSWHHTWHCLLKPR